jgi:hypothetical protein
MGSVEIQLLGRFEVKVDGRSLPASAWRHRRAAGLVKLLALASGHWEHREQVIEALWPHLPPEGGKRNLTCRSLVLIYSQQSGEAHRLSPAKPRRIDREELRRIAGGRNDILAEAAGITPGSWYASPATQVAMS